MFKSEQEMSIKFEKFLKKNFGNSYFKEYEGLFGIPDFLFFQKENKQSMLVISFELKLKDWRRAAIQAFRYKSFSNIAYVVLPNNSAMNALNNINIFETYNIGLASFNGEDFFEILYMPKATSPYSNSLSTKLTEVIKKKKTKSKNVEMLVTSC